jgi:uncharacterized protein
MANEDDVRDRGPLKCPKCNGTMEVVAVLGTEVDRCTICHGIWLDPGEAKALVESMLAGKLDVGSAERGAEMNNRAFRNCPKCRTRLIHQRDTEQRHIEFESCQVCFGAYFDAGELTDLQNKELFEGVKRWWREVRG